MAQISISEFSAVSRSLLPNVVTTKAGELEQAREIGDGHGRQPESLQHDAHKLDRRLPWSARQLGGCDRPFEIAIDFDDRSAGISLALQIFEAVLNRRRDGFMLARWPVCWRPAVGDPASQIIMPRLPPPARTMRAPISPVVIGDAG